MPRVSVVMPVLNRAAYLPAAIESIAAQTYADWELVISDGGSADGSLDIMRRYAATDSRVRVYSHPGTNAPEGRNAALAEARGEYVAMLDSDDVARPGRLERQVEFLDAHPAVTAVGGNFDFIDAAGEPMNLDKYATRLTDPAELRRRTALGWHCFLQSTMLFRRAALTEVGGYRALFRYAEEDDLYYRLYGNDAVMTNLPDKLVSYRWHGGNACIPSVTTQLYRVVALASAHARWNGLPDPVENRIEPFDLTFLNSAFAGLGEMGLAARLFWIALLQRYNVAPAETLRSAWTAASALPAGELTDEVRRHWSICNKDYPEVAQVVRAAAAATAAGPGTVGRILAGTEA